MVTSEKVRKVATGVLLALVVGAPAAASWHGLTAAGEQMLGLPGVWAALVPLTLDAAALFAAVLALRDVIQGDAAGMNRVLVWAYALGSAGLNAWHADRVGGLPAAVFYAVASISAVILWDRLLRAMRRDQLRALGAVAAPTPRFRAARWVCAPAETARAWRLAVLEGVTDPAEAVRLARQVDELPPVDTGDRVDRRDAGDVAPELVGLSKADAVRAARRALTDGDEQGPTALAAWLRSAGVEVTPAYVADVARRDRQRGPLADTGTTTTDEPAPLRLAN